MKNHTRFSKASGSERAKLRKLQQRGWCLGMGRIGDWLRSPRRLKRVFKTIEASEDGL